MPLRVFLVEDHATMRKVLSDFITKQCGCEIGGEAGTAEEALEQLGHAGVDVALIDVSLPKMSGIELVRKLKTRFPSLPCLMLSAHPTMHYVREAMEAGARGYILKGNPYELGEGLATIGNGGTFLSEALRQSPSEAI